MDEEDRRLIRERYAARGTRPVGSTPRRPTASVRGTQRGPTAGGSRPGDGAKAGSDKGSGALILKPAILHDPKTIKPREWMYGTQLIRGFVTVLVAPGGTGKTAYAMLVGAALSSGQNLLGEHVYERTNVAVLNLEDPVDELDRRFAAIRIRYLLGEDEVGGRYFLHSGEQRTVTIADMDEDGFRIISPDGDALIEQLKANNIGCIIIDPYAESHSLEENSNPQMVAAAAEWRRVAREARCAVLLVHHVRKGPTDSIDSARGAKALTDSARIGLLMSPMTEQDGEFFGVEQGEHLSYVRLDQAKANMAARSSTSLWLKHCPINLGNGQGLYPNGDSVGVVEQWVPPSLWDHIPMEQYNLVMDAIDAGPQPGKLYSEKPGDRWVGNVLIEICDMNETQAKAIVKAWTSPSTRVLVQDPTYKHRGQPVSGLRVNPAKRAGPVR